MYPMHNVTGKSLKYNKACNYTGLGGSKYYIENVMSFVRN